MEPSLTYLEVVNPLKGALFYNAIILLYIIYIIYYAIILLTAIMMLSLSVKMYLVV